MMAFGDAGPDMHCTINDEEGPQTAELRARRSPTAGILNAAKTKSLVTRAFDLAFVSKVDGVGETDLLAIATRHTR
jgi:hypothetical protein